jgi:predicted DNA-binding transcriptional regulator AlpA
MKGISISTDALTKPSLFDPLLSVNDVMEVLGASRTSVYAWLRGASCGA